MFVDLLNCLKPVDTPYPKTRVGPINDGGYVLVDHGLDDIDAVLSYGGGDNLDFENQFVADHPRCMVYAHDHTIENFPTANPNVRCVPEGVGPVENGRVKTIARHIQNYALVDKTMILKMNVEFHEWATLNALAEELLIKFNQLVIEFHHFHHKYDLFQRVYKKLNKIFYLAHAHANNALGEIVSREAGGLKLPILLETTYIRRDLVAAVTPPAGSFPKPPDMPNLPDKPDLSLHYYPFRWGHRGMHWIVQYYRDKNAARQRELDECLQRNLDNSVIACVHLLLEDRTQAPDISHNRLHVQTLGHRMTYQDAFDYASVELSGEICCAANADIFLDTSFDSLDIVFDHVTAGRVLCLSRHEYVDGQSLLDESFTKLWFADTQDAWIFLSPLVGLKNHDFPLGILGCDNAIADRIRRAGYQPVNLNRLVKINHLDRVRGKTNHNFMQHHNRDMSDQQRYPEEQGQYLIPDYDLVMSLGMDKLADRLRLTPQEKYRWLCEMITRKLKIRNR